MKRETTRVAVTRHPFSLRSFGFHIARFMPDGKVGVVEPLSLRITEPEVVAVLPDTPAFELDEKEASRLMDELWRAGVRPSEVGSPGQLAATQAHLQDMRALVFKTPPPK